MSYDPYAHGSDVPPPDYGSAYPPTADKSNARARVLAPAISLIVVGILNLLMAAAPAFYGLSATKVSPAQLEEQMQKQNPQVLADMKKQGWTVSDVRNWLIYGSFSWAGLDFLASFLVILGGVRMLSLKNYGLAVFSSILAALPVVSCSGCCGLGVIAGIWALVVLLNAEVKSAFQ